MGTFGPTPSGGPGKPTVAHGLDGSFEGPRYSRYILTPVTGSSPGIDHTGSDFFCGPIGCNISMQTHEVTGACLLASKVAQLMTGNRSTRRFAPFVWVATELAVPLMSKPVSKSP